MGIERDWKGMVWCGMVWYGVVWYGMVWYGMVWYGIVWNGMEWYGTVWYGMVWYGRPRGPSGGRSWIAHCPIATTKKEKVGWLVILCLSIGR
jgi:hypothetical protein